jgi:hypothetical protein
MCNSYERSVPQQRLMICCFCAFSRSRNTCLTSIYFKLNNYECLKYQQQMCTCQKISLIIIIWVADLFFNHCFLERSMTFYFDTDICLFVQLLDAINLVLIKYYLRRQEKKKAKYITFSRTRGGMANH